MKIWHLYVRMGTCVSFFFALGAIQAQANPDPNEYLASVSLRLAQIQESEFNDASRIIYAQYCPEQSDKIINAMTTLIQNNPKISWAYLANAEEEWIKETLNQCEKRERVDTLLQSFNREIAERALQILNQIQTYINLKADEVSSFDEAREQADLLLQTLIEVNLSSKEILNLLENQKENDSQYRSAKLRFMNRKAKLPIEGERLSDRKDDRCFKCRKSVTVPINCRCGQSFCIKHRSAESHSCSFDYKSHFKKELEENNPKIEAPKLDPL